MIITIQCLPRNQPLILLLLKKHPGKRLGLVNVVCNSRASTIPGPSIVEVDVLAQLRIHEHVWCSDQRTHDVAVQAVRNDEIRTAQKLEALNRFCPGTLVLAFLVLSNFYLFAVLILARDDWEISAGDSKAIPFADNGVLDLGGSVGKVTYRKVDWKFTKTPGINIEKVKNKDVVPRKG